MNDELKNLKFSEAVDEWLKFKKPVVKESTYLNYKYKVNKKFKKQFGEKSIKEIQKYDFNRFINNQLEKYSTKTVKDITSVLKQILSYFEKKYSISFKLELITSPKLRHHDIELMDDKDRIRLEKYCMSSNKMKDIGILLSLYGGLRIGEVCALKWKNIDLNKKIIIIDHTLQRVYIKKSKTKIIYTSPKTENSERIIPIANILLNKLKSMYNKNCYNGEEFVLTGKKEQWIEPIMYRYSYKKILDKNNILYKKYHILRHTFATRCVKIGMDIKSLSEILGHSNVSITLDLYVHPSLETKNKYINKL